MMISSRRTRLNPEQVNNAMFLRSVKRMNDWLLFCLFFNVYVILFRNYLYVFELCCFYLMK
jgi:hypothetical protein